MVYSEYRAWKSGQWVLMSFGVFQRAVRVTYLVHSTLWLIPMGHSAEKKSSFFRLLFPYILA